MESNKSVISFILWAVVLALAFGLILPKYREFKALETELSKKQGEYKGGEAYYQKIAQAYQEINSRKEILDKIDSALSPSASVASLLSFFHVTAVKTDMNVESISFLNAPALNFESGQTQGRLASPSEVIFSVDLTGNYQNFKKFIFTLENSIRLFEVDAITLFPLQNSSTGPGSAGQIQGFKLQVRTYIY